MAKFKVMATLLTINTIMKIVEATDMKEATRRVLDSSSFQDWTSKDELKTRTISV